MKNRGNLVLSKAVALFVYTILTMAFYLVIQAIAQAACFHELQIGAVRDFAAYTGTQTLLQIVGLNGHLCHIRRTV